MSKKSLPYLFLSLLLAILLFTVGLRYGQHVEKINKNVSYLTGLPPTATTVPTAPPLEFSLYSHPCGASFLIPTVLEKTKESSSSALFSTRQKKLAIALSCEKKPLIQDKSEKVITLNEARMYETTTADTVSYRFVNPKNGYVVTATAAKEYALLLQNSLSLLK